MIKNNGAISFEANSNYIPGLDGLRAISILIVFVSHLGFGNIIPGGLGVTIFFFLSGFLITRLLVGEQNQSGGNIKLKDFYIRRFLRLMPALYFFIFIVSFLAIPFGGKPLLVHILAACFYFVNYYDALAPILNYPVRIVPWGHLWSLAIEEHFYLIFPLCLSLFGKNHKGRIFLVVGTIILSAAMRFIDISIFKLDGEYTYRATECRIENIAWGCLLAVLLDGVVKIEKPKLAYFANFAWLIIGIGAVLFSVFFRDEFFRATWRYSVQGAAIFILVFNLYALEIGKVFLAILETKPMRFIGRLSYSLYLWHWVFIWIAMQIEHSETISHQSFIWVIPAGILAAILSYYGIERPFFALRRKFGGHPVETMVK